VRRASSLLLFSPRRQEVGGEEAGRGKGIGGEEDGNNGLGLTRKCRSGRRFRGGDWAAA